MHWDIASQTTNLYDQDVHIWMVNLQEHYAASKYYIKFLSEHERERAHRYMHEKDDKYFVIARAILKILVGQYMSLNPKKIDFSYGLYGKPYLDVKDPKNTLHFNLSHSGDLALYIFSKCGEVGIDIEIIKHIDELESIAKHILSYKENIILQSAPSDSKLEIFFRCWTRKEAFAKTIGKGLSYPFDKFEVISSLTAKASLVKVDEDPSLVYKLRLLDLNFCSGYVGACLFNSSVKKLRYFKCATYESFYLA